MKNKNQIYLLSGLVAVALLAVGVMTYSNAGGQNQVSTRPAAKAAETTSDAGSNVSSSDAGSELSFSSKKNPEKVPAGLAKKCLDNDGCIFVSPNEPVKVAPFLQIATFPQYSCATGYTLSLANLPNPTPLTCTTIPKCNDAAPADTLILPTVDANCTVGTTSEGLTTGGRSVGGAQAARGMYIAREDRPQVLGHEVMFVGDTTTDIGRTGATSDVPSGTQEHVVLFKHFQDPGSAVRILRLGTTEFLVANCGLPTASMTSEQQLNCQPGAADVAKSIVDSDPEIVAVLGTTNSGSASGNKSYIVSDGTAVRNTSSTKVIGANEYLSSQEMLQFSPNALAPSLTYACTPEVVDGKLVNDDTTCREPYFARTAPSQGEQGIAMANYVYTQESQEHSTRQPTAATIHDSRVNNAETVDAFQKEFIRLGGRITHKESIPGTTPISGANATCMDIAVDRCLEDLITIVGDVPDFIFASFTFPRPGSQLLKDARTSTTLVGGVPLNTRLDGTRFGGYNTWGVAQIYNTVAGDYAEGLLVTNIDTSTFSTTYQSYRIPPVVGYQNWLTQEHNPQFGLPLAQFQHANGNDAYNLLLDAIEQVTIQTEDLGGWIIIPRKALIDKLLENRETEGLVGKLNCDRPTSGAINYNQGDCSNLALEIDEVQNCTGSTPEATTCTFRKVFP